MTPIRPVLNLLLDHLQRRWHLHAILWPAAIGGALILAYLTGVFTSTTAEHYFADHFRASLPVPTARQPIAPTTRSLPSLAGIELARYPEVGNQDGTGSCAAWATAWTLSYEWRRQHPTSWLRFSPRQMYDHYSDTYSGGADAGSWPDPDAEISSTAGLLQFKALPEPPYAIDNPIPATDAWGHPAAVDAAKHRFGIDFTHIQGFAQGGGQGLVDAIKQTIASGHPTLIALPVYPEYDNATIQPNIAPPKAGESNRGGHSNVALAYDDTRPMPDGTHGALLIQNQWSSAWGLAGRAWLSYSFVRQYVFGSEWASLLPLSGAPALPKPIFLPNPAPVHTAASAPALAPRANSWYVQHVPGYEYENGRTVYTQDLAPLINAWGDRYHISPIGITGTLLTESGGIINAERWAGKLDNSCGLLQQIITNVQAYTGIQGAINQCRWEEDPAHSIYLGARMLRECSDQHGGRIPFAYLDVGYNAGCGWPDSFFYDPTASDVRAHLAAYIGNYDYALAHYAAPAPPPRRTFPFARWNAYANRHQEKPITPYWHGKLSWAASIWVNHQAACHGIRHKDAWHSRGRYSSTRFAKCTILTWPRFHTGKVAST